MNDFENKELASKAGRKSKRGKGIKTQLTEYLIDRLNREKNGESPITMEDLKKNSPAVWLYLRENAETWQEVLLCESHLSKFLHTVKLEHSGEIINDVKINIVKE